LVVVLVFIVVVVAFTLAGKVINMFIGVHLLSLAEVREKEVRERGKIERERQEERER